MHRDAMLAALTKLLARLLLPIAALRFGRRGARWAAAQWALGLRFPAEDLRGLRPGTHHAFTCARTEALWRDGQLIGLTSGHRDAAVQYRLYVADLRRPGAELPRALPPERSAHVRGSAIDVRPTEGAQWLEAHGWRFALYRTYDNEWWHFEHHTAGPPPRMPYPGARPASRSRW